ncbi:MAG: c-type cytochrome, partial [Steroidobacteraceae bacterium]
MRRHDSCAVLAALLALVVYSAAYADATRDSSAAMIAQRGAPHGAPPCSSCHGQAGEGIAATGFPRLAGLPAAYLLAQLDALASGIRQSPVMGPLAQGLSPRERSQLADYYAALPGPVGATAAAGARLDDGLALHGRWSDEIPGCVQCHGANGSGVGATFPPLAGQPAVYIANQLRAWKQGTRRGEPLNLMQAIASRLSERDIRAVSD